MHGSEGNSKDTRQETRRERRARLRRLSEARSGSHVLISPWWGIGTAFHLWEQIFFTCPWRYREGFPVQPREESKRVYEYDVQRLLAELPRYQYQRYLRMNGG